MAVSAVDDKEKLGGAVLAYLQDAFGEAAPTSGKTLISLDLAEQLRAEHEKVAGTLNSLASKSQVTLSEPFERVTWFLTPEGQSYADVGSPEWRLLEHVAAAAEPPTVQDVQARCAREVADVGLKTALKLKWLALDKPTKTLKTMVDVAAAEDACAAALRHVRAAAEEKQTEIEVLARLGDGEHAKKTLQELKRRKLADCRRVKYYEVTRGPAFSLTIKKLATDLTQEMILRDTWQDLEFKPYNFFAAGIRPQRGSVHPLIRVLKKFKRILVSMGFEEMPTQDWVESSFWNFDVLFQPQQHPARDVQDTFFLKEPAKANGAMLPEDYVERVKETHEVGGNGSIGWRCDW